MRKIIFVLSLYLFAFSSSYSQNIPEDPYTVKGHLTNGLTYYVRTNKHPENKVYLRLVVNAGSALENDRQRGLAHFLEHMAFSGTRDFPGSLLIDTLQSIGVRFGKELNAYTSFDETVFYLPIPRDKVDLGMRIASNWALHLNLTEKAIDRERNVILEEMRLGVNSRTRLQEQYLPVLFGGSPYPLRLPIGTADVVANFKYNELRDFYKKWYTPELMAVIVVGDIEKEDAIALIKKYFNTQPASRHKTLRPSYFPDIHKKVRTVIATDKEKKNCSVEVVCKHHAKRVITEKEYKDKLCDKLFSYMMSNRLDALMDTLSANVTDADIAYSNHFRYIDTYSLFAICDPEDVLKTYISLVDEYKRVRKYGFSQSELTAAKNKLKTNYLRWYKEREKSVSEDYTDSYQMAFLFNQPEPGIEWEYNKVNSFLPAISLKDMNSLPQKYMGKKNRVIVITGPDNKIYPDKETLLDVLDNEDTKQIKPFVEEKPVMALMDKLPKKGSIVKEEKIDSLGIIRWTLSNKLVVLLRPTDYKDNEILYRATGDGGYSMYDDKDVMSAVNATGIQDDSGVNGISNRQLKKLMNGKNIAITQSLSYYNESMWGKVAPENIETLMQLIHIYHLSPYFDEKSASKYIRKCKSNYSYLKTTAESCFDYFTDSIMNGGNFRATPWPLTSELSKIDCKRAQQIYKDRFSNAAGFTYIFVGNINIEKMRELAQTYLASLPVDEASKRVCVDWSAVDPKKDISYYKYENKENKSVVKVRFRKHVVWNSKLAKSYDAFIDILNSRLFQSLRMEMSGVYGVKVSGSVSRLHNQESTLNLAFSCNPNMTAALLKRTLDEIKTLWTDGPTDDEVNQFKEKNRISLMSTSKNNATLLTDIMNSVRAKTLPNTLEKQLYDIKSVDRNSIVESVHSYLQPDESIRFILMPSKELK